MPFDNLPYSDLMEKHGFIPADHSAPKFFPVEARKLYDEKGVELDGYRRIVNAEDGHTLHVASDTYRIVTNEEAFGAFEDSLRSSDLDLTGMAIGTDYSNGGSRCFRQYLLPAHRVEVKKGVETALRLIMMNSYDGSIAFQGRAGGYTFVCANTSVIGNDIAQFKMRHQGGIDVQKAIKGLTEAALSYDREAKRWQTWAQIGVQDLQVRKLFEEVPQGTRQLTEHLLHQYVVARDTDEKQGGPNLWTAYSVLTAWSSHGEPQGAGGVVRVDHKVNAKIRQERETRVAKLIEGVTWKELEAA